MTKGLLDNARTRQITADEAAVLEERLRETPDDVGARFDVTCFYWSNQWLGEDASRYQKSHARHVLWMIRNAPESAGPYWAQFTIDRRGNPKSYGKAERAWIRQIRKHPQNSRILWNASLFLLNQNLKTAERILTKGIRLEPNSVDWLARLGLLHSLGLLTARTKASKQYYAKRSFAAYKAAKRLSASRMSEGHEVDLARAAYRASKYTEAEKYAQALIRWKVDNEAPQGREGNDAIHHGNTLLGKLALRAGEVDSAKRYLLASGDVAGSPVLNSFGPSMTLVKELLERGEQEVVLSYFELCAKFWKHHAEKLQDWATAVKRGNVPEFGSSLNR